MIASPRPIFLQIRSFILSAGIIALAMWFSYHFQQKHLAFLNIDPRISLFYLPAGVITISTLVSPKAAPFGIFLGALVANLMYPPSVAFLEDVAMSMIPGLCALGAVIVLYWLEGQLDDLYRDNKTLPEIDGIDVFYFCCLYGVFNTFTHQLLFATDHDYGVSFTVTKALGMWFGDLTGAFLVFVALNIGYVIYKRVINVIM